MCVGYIGNYCVQHFLGEKAPDSRQLAPVGVKDEKLSLLVAVGYLNSSCFSSPPFSSAQQTRSTLSSRAQAAPDEGWLDRATSSCLDGPCDQVCQLSSRGDCHQVITCLLALPTG